jgi:hypothetical protein
MLCSRVVWSTAQRYILYKKPKFIYNLFIQLIEKHKTRIFAVNYVVMLQHERKNNRLWSNNFEKSNLKFFCNIFFVKKIFTKCSRKNYKFVPLTNLNKYLYNGKSEINVNINNSS